jgi:hypothetical protein
MQPDPGPALAHLQCTVLPLGSVLYMAENVCGAGFFSEHTDYPGASIPTSLFPHGGKINVSEDGVHLDITKMLWNQFRLKKYRVVDMTKVLPHAQPEHAATN